MYKCQKNFLSNESRQRVGGCVNIVNLVRLTMINRTVTVYQYIMNLRSKQDSSVVKVPGMDEVDNYKETYLFWSTPEHFEELKECIEDLLNEIKILIHPEDISKFFVDPNIGIISNFHQPIRYKSTSTM